MWTVLKEIGPQFERTSGYKLNVITGTAATLADRIREGEHFDVFIGSPVQMNRVIQNNKIIADTRTAIAHSGIGVEVRAGAPKPDISSVEAFRQALLNAKSIGYLKQEGTSGAYLHDLFDRIGISDAIRSKIVRPEADIVSERVAKGEIELGQERTFESIAGSRFSGAVARAAKAGPHEAIIARVGGRAYYSGRAEFTVEPDDELGRGFLLR